MKIRIVRGISSFWFYNYVGCSFEVVKKEGFKMPFYYVKLDNNLKGIDGEYCIEE